MDEKGLNLHSIFRMLIPGYVFILVVGSFYVLCPAFFPFDKEIFSPGLIGILGLPIGFLIHACYTIMWYWPWESWTHRKIGKICRRNNRGNDIRNNKRFAALALNLLFQKEKERFGNHIYFLHTRMHSYGTAICAILFGLLISSILVNVAYILFMPIFYFWIALSILLLIAKIRQGHIIDWWLEGLLLRYGEEVIGYAKEMPIQNNANGGKVMKKIYTWISIGIIFLSAYVFLFSEYFGWFGKGTPPAILLCLAILIISERVIACLHRKKFLSKAFKIVFLIILSFVSLAALYINYKNAANTKKDFILTTTILVSNAEKIEKDGPIDFVALGYYEDNNYNSCIPKYIDGSNPDFMPAFNRGNKLFEVHQYYFAAREYELAIKKLKDSKSSNKQYWAYLYQNLGIAYNSMGLKGRAIEALEKSIEFSRENPAKLGHIGAYRVLAHLYAEKSNKWYFKMHSEKYFNRAISILNEALAVEDRGWQTGEMVYRDLVDIYLAKGKTEKAEGVKDLVKQKFKKWGEDPNNLLDARLKTNIEK